MIIVCESKKEYAELMKTIRYMHDFVVEGKDNLYHSLDQRVGLVGSILHLYLDPPDFEDKHKYVMVKSKKQIKKFVEG